MTVKLVFWPALATLLLSSCAVANSNGNSNNSATAEHMTSLVPWLVLDQNGGSRRARYGYRNPTRGTVVIPARYADARPFHNGYAVVARFTPDEPSSGFKYGVIDRRGDAVIPLKYDYVEMVPKGALNLVFTRHDYNAWWRFWQWNGISLLSNTPITRVSRQQWTVQTLPSRQTLFSERMSYLRGQSPGRGYHHGHVLGHEGYDGYVIPYSINVTASEKQLRIANRLYVIQDDSSLKRVSGQVAGFTATGDALVTDGARLRIIDGQGHTASRQRFTPTDTLHVVDTRGDDITRKIPPFSGRRYLWQALEGIENPPLARSSARLFTPNLTWREHSIHQRPLYRDSQGRYYVAPNFATPLPQAIQDYHSPTGSYSAADIVRHCRFIVALPAGRRFLVGTTEAFSEPGRAFILHADGSWDTRMPALRKPAQIFSGGRILFLGKNTRGILTATGRFLPMPIINVGPSEKNPMWFYGLDPDTTHYGVYDAAQGRWQVPPRFDYLREERVPGIAVYRQDRPAARPLYGLVNIATGETVTEPVYRFIDTDGRVGRSRTITNTYGVTLDVFVSFYLDPRTGQAFMSPAPAPVRRDAATE